MIWWDVRQRLRSVGRVYTLATDTFSEINKSTILESARDQQIGGKLNQLDSEWMIKLKSDCNNILAINLQISELIKTKHELMEVNRWVATANSSSLTKQEKSLTCDMQNIIKYGGLVNFTVAEGKHKLGVNEK